MNTSQPPGQGKHVAAGIGLSFLLHLLVPGSIYLITTLLDSKLGILGGWIFINLVFTVCIGLTQWIYLLPTALYFSNRKRGAVAKGVMIGGALTMLLNGLCFALFVTGHLGRIAG